MTTPKHPGLPPGVHQGRVYCLPRRCASVSPHSSCSALNRTLPFPSVAAAVPLGGGRRSGPAPETGGSGQTLVRETLPGTRSLGNKKCWLDGREAHASEGEQLQ